MNNDEEIEVHDAFSHIDSVYLTKKHEKIGRISPNRQKQSDENTTLLYLYHHIVMAIDDLAYFHKDHQQ